MSDTTTILSRGTQDGDVMDADLITQSDGVTQAKAQRVELRGTATGSTVQPAAADPGANPYSLPALAVALVDDGPPGGYLVGEIRPLSATSEGRLRVSDSPAITYLDMFGDTSPLATDPDECTLTDLGDNPYGL